MTDQEFGNEVMYILDEHLPHIVSEELSYQIQKLLKQIREEEFDKGVKFATDIALKLMK